MYTKKLGDDIRCPAEYTLKVLSGKWKMRVWCIVYNYGPIKYGEILDRINGISHPVLSSTLKDMCSLGIFRRITHEDSPQLVEYMISDDYDGSMTPILQGMCRWGMSHIREYDGEAYDYCAKCKYRIEQNNA